MICHTITCFYQPFNHNSRVSLSLEFSRLLENRTLHFFVLALLSCILFIVSSWRCNDSRICDEELSVVFYLRATHYLFIVISLWAHLLTRKRCWKASANRSSCRMVNGTLASVIDAGHFDQGFALPNSTGLPQGVGELCSRNDRA
jgi:hypothetical protein